MTETLFKPKLKAEPPETATRASESTATPETTTEETEGATVTAKSDKLTATPPTLKDNKPVTLERATRTLNSYDLED